VGCASGQQWTQLCHGSTQGLCGALPCRLTLLPLSQLLLLLPQQLCLTALLPALHKWLAFRGGLCFAGQLSERPVGERARPLLPAAEQLAEPIVVHCAAATPPGLLAACWRGCAYDDDVARRARRRPARGARAH
jgi:hypothetical protein